MCTHPLGQGFTHVLFNALSTQAPELRSNYSSIMVWKIMLSVEIKAALRAGRLVSRMILHWGQQHVWLESSCCFTRSWFPVTPNTCRAHFLRLWKPTLYHLQTLTHSPACLTPESRRSLSSSASSACRESRPHLEGCTHSALQSQCRLSVLERDRSLTSTDLITLVVQHPNQEREMT